MTTSNCTQLLSVTEDLQLARWPELAQKISLADILTCLNAAEPVGESMILGTQNLVYSAKTAILPNVQEVVTIFYQNDNWSKIEVQCNTEEINIGHVIPNEWPEPEVILDFSAGTTVTDFSEITNVCPAQGLAFFVDPEDGRLLRFELFKPMSTNEYLATLRDESDMDDIDLDDYLEEEE
ncbi:hypothetical protein LX64_04775 [Chitinophaga skermanii]|uniref:Uncharacterized protein n=1 Tax=Chitinophaga skermanii TaxID=331697 RepID=A0A327Q306_9BACT|nr:hypothetical protein [Chitinophaga skermanii]RAI98413.1 hypothetical protein LX64_04775 [Chitinophaga skermanii]